MLDRLPTREPTAYDDDDWEDRPAQSAFHQYGLGVALPLAMATWGIAGIVTRSISMTSRGNVSWTFVGTNAVALGIAWLSAAVFVHCHYFWGNVYDGNGYAELGKIAGAIGFIGGVGVVLVRNGVFGLR